MTIPLVILAVFAIVLGFIGTPAWPWFHSFLEGHHAHAEFGKLFKADVLGLMVLSAVIVLVGMGLGWWLYARKPLSVSEEPLEKLQPDIFTLLRRKYFVDEAYELTLVRLNRWFAKACDFLDYWVWNGLVRVVSLVVIGLAWVDRIFDEKVIDGGFDQGCRGVSESGGLLSRLQNGRVQTYLRVLGIALTVLVLLLIWGCRG
jgi:NADH-quinone oxidoreductase subunit L